MTDVADAQGRFVAVLASLCAPMDKEAAAQALMAMMPSLSDMPPDVWCSASAEFCARKFANLPNYARLRRTLAGWWDDHRPRLAIAAPSLDHSSLSADAAGAARAWLAAKASTGDLDLARRLDVLRLYVEPAYTYLLEHDPTAADVARKRGWTREAAETPLTADAARDAAARAQAALTAQQAANPRPNNALPAPPPKSAVIAHPVSPEHLRRIREAAGIQIPVPAATPTAPADSPPDFTFADDEGHA